MEDWIYSRGISQTFLGNFRKFGKITGKFLRKIKKNLEDFKEIVEIILGNLATHSGCSVEILS